MAIDFPNSPSTNDQYTVGTTTWMYNGTAWVIVLGESAIATDAVTTAKIAALAVTDAKLASDSVTTAKIATNAITAAKLAAGASNAYVLTADSSTTSGVKWSIIPPSGGLSTTTEGAIMTMTIGA